MASCMNDHRNVAEADGFSGKCFPVVTRDGSSPGRLTHKFLDALSPLSKAILVFVVLSDPGSRIIQLAHGTGTIRMVLENNHNFYGG